jgi:rhodanese-related sulfurtransferase
MNNRKRILFSLILLAAPLAWSQQPPAAGAPAAADEYHFKTKRLSRAEVDGFLAAPEKVVFIELRRPDQVAADGSFPVYLAILAKDLEQNLKYIPKDRAIVTVGLHARFGGAAGDLLTSKGYKVAGAVGIEDYIKEGGTITKVAIPPARPANTAK